jgi:hypothetical protein
MKSNESTWEFIAAIAFALFMAVLIGLWFMELTRTFRHMETTHNKTLEMRGSATGS